MASSRADKADQSAGVAERIRIAVENMKFDNGAKCTVSIGLAKAQSEDNIDELINRADEALYHAKQTGKNRVCVVARRAASSSLAATMAFTPTIT